MAFIALAGRAGDQSPVRRHRAWRGQDAGRRGREAWALHRALLVAAIGTLPVFIRLVDWHLLVPAMHRWASGVPGWQLRFGRPPLPHLARLALLPYQSLNPIPIERTA